MKYVLATASVFLAACVLGCGSSSQTKDSSQEFASKSLNQILDIAMEQAGEIGFCLSEGADAELLKNPISRIRGVAKVLPERIADSELSPQQKAQMTNAIEKLKSACERMSNSIEAHSTSAETSKASLEIAKQVERMLRLAN